MDDAREASHQSSGRVYLVSIVVGAVVVSFLAPLFGIAAPPTVYFTVVPLAASALVGVAAFWAAGRDERTRGARRGLSGILVRMLLVGVLSAGLKLALFAASVSGYDAPLFFYQVVAGPGAALEGVFLGALAGYWAVRQ